MSDPFALPVESAQDGSRRRALWGLLILALLAVLVVGAMLLFMDTSGGTPHPQGLGDVSGNATQPAPGNATQPVRSTPKPSPSTSVSPTRSPSTSPRPKPTSTANPCPSTSPCVVAGDAGEAVSAVNKFRLGHGRSAVHATVSAQAQQCALHQGSGPTCEPHFAWEPLAGQDGQTVIRMIAARGDGTRWLLDPGMSSFSVGWAYLPGSGASAGQYECVVLKVG